MSSEATSPSKFELYNRILEFEMNDGTKYYNIHTVQETEKGKSYSVFPTAKCCSDTPENVIKSLEALVAEIRANPLPIKID